MVRVVLLLGLLLLLLAGITLSGSSEVGTRVIVTGSIPARYVVVAEPGVDPYLADLKE